MVSVDISTQETLGVVRELVAHVGEDTPEQRSDVLSIYSLGKQRVMPTGRMVVTAPVGGVAEAVVDGELIVTDNGGALQPYGRVHGDVLSLYPKNEGMVLQATVEYCELARDGSDTLLIYPANVEGNDQFALQRPHAFYGTLESPVSVISNGQSGGLVIKHTYNPRTSAKGYLIRVREVPKVSGLELVSVEYTPDFIERNMAVKAVVKNLLTVPQTNARLLLFTGEDAKRRNLIAQYDLPRIEAEGQVEFTFPKPVGIDLPYRTTFWLVADGYNTQLDEKVINEQTLLLDRYCAAGAAGAAPASGYNPTFNTLTLYGKLNRLGRASSCVLRLKDTMAVWNQAADNKLYGKVYDAEDGMVVAAHIDWNDDGVFGDAESGELQVFPVSSTQSEFTLEFKAPVDTQFGVKRVRLVYALEAQSTACREEQLTKGEAVDFCINYQEGKFPTAGDVELVKLETAKTGRNLTSSEKIELTLRNHSDTQVEEVTVYYSIDDQPEQKEVLTVALPPYGQKA